MADQRRWVFVSFTLVALLVCVLPFLRRHSTGLLVGKEQPAREESLHYGKNYFEHKFGVNGSLNHHWWCGHYFRSLCHNTWIKHAEGDYAKEWYQKTDWLDYSAKLEKAHNIDEQEEIAFHEAINELHDRVLAKRNVTDQLRKEIDESRNAQLAAVKLHQQEQEDNTKAKLLQEEAEIEDAEARVNAEYLQRIANISTGWKEYEESLDEARKQDLERRTEFHTLLDHMKQAGATFKQIRNAELEFKWQEKTFNSNVELLQKGFNEQKRRYAKDEQEARAALSMYNEETAKEGQKMVQKEREQSNVEKQVENKVDNDFKADTAAWAKSNGRLMYTTNLESAKSSEEKSVSVFEAKIAGMKKKELLHSQAMQKKADAEAERSVQQISQAKETAVTSLSNLARMRNDAVLKVLLPSKVDSPAALQELTQAKTKTAVNEGKWSDRREAFFRAMRAQAQATQAKFETISHNSPPQL